MRFLIIAILVNNAFKIILRCIILEDCYNCGVGINL